MNKALTVLAALATAVLAETMPSLPQAPVLSATPAQPWQGAVTARYPETDATLQMGQADGFLFVRLDAFHGRPDMQLAVQTRHDTPVYADDNVDIFMAPEGENGGYYQVIANTRGTLFDHYVDSLRRDHLDWDSGASAVGSFYGDRFHIEVKIPIASLAPSQGKLLINVCRYTRWDMKGIPLWGKYHQPSTWKCFELGSTFPVRLRKASFPNFSGQQTATFDLLNTSDAPLHLKGDFDGAPVKITLPPRESATLECAVNNFPDKELTNRLRLTHDGRTVIESCRTLTPKPNFRVTAVSDILWEGEKLQLAIMVNEKQTENVSVQVGADSAACTYKGETITIPYETIPSPWTR